MMLLRRGAGASSYGDVQEGRGSEEQMETTTLMKSTFAEEPSLEEQRATASTLPLRLPSDFDVEGVERSEKKVWGGVMSRSAAFGWRKAGAKTWGQSL